MSETDERTGMASLRQRSAASRLQNGQATGEDKAAEAPLKVPRTPDRVDRGRWRSGSVCLTPIKSNKLTDCGVPSPQP